MNSPFLRLLRFAIVVQVLVTAWFAFSPDLLPPAFVEAEMKNDKPIYAWIDSIIVPLSYIQTLLCLALWFPTRIVSWLFVACLVAIAILSSFAGPAVLSAIDGLLSYLQVLASGAMIASLYSSEMFSFLWRKNG